MQKNRNQEYFDKVKGHTNGNSPVIVVKDGQFSRNKTKNFTNTNKKPPGMESSQAIRQ